ncbi:MAG: hypothetical protein J6334_11730 [Kiritimatiellae bacterium]|nr:hypothetical protein [Kiritimatiellia bacterium]
MRGTIAVFCAVAAAGGWYRPVNADESKTVNLHQSKEIHHVNRFDP